MDNLWPEVGQTVRTAIGSTPATVRLCVITILAALVAAVILKLRFSCCRASEAEALPSPSEAAERPRNPLPPASGSTSHRGDVDPGSGGCVVTLTWTTLIVAVTATRSEEK